MIVSINLSDGFKIVENTLDQWCSFVAAGGAIWLFMGSLLYDYECPPKPTACTLGDGVVVGAWTLAVIYIVIRFWATRDE